MVNFILGLSLMFNVLFVAFFIYGWIIDKRMKREAKKILSSTKLPTELYKKWMYDA